MDFRPGDKIGSHKTRIRTCSHFLVTVCNGYLFTAFIVNRYSFTWLWSTVLVKGNLRNRAAWGSYPTSANYDDISRVCGFYRQTVVLISCIQLKNASYFCSSQSGVVAHLVCSIKDSLHYFGLFTIESQISKSHCGFHFASDGPSVVHGNLDFRVKECILDLIVNITLSWT